MTREPAAVGTDADTLSVTGIDLRWNRLTWMDTLRGAAILLVVVLHASALAQVLSGVVAPEWMGTVNAAVAPFRMPLLMLLSGLLLARALSKPPARYIVGKVRRLLWPYLVWSGVYWLVMGTDSIPSVQAGIATSWLWYLLYLMTFFAIAPFTTLVARWMMPLALWIASALAPDPILAHYLLYAGYFFAGDALWRYRFSWVPHDGRWMLLLALGTTIALSTVHAVQGGGTTFALPLRVDEVVTAPLTIVGIVGLMLLARRLPDAATRPLRYIGRNSIVFYVSHYPAQILVTAGLERIGVYDWALHAGAGVIVALAIGFAFCALRRLAVVEALFTLPWPDRRGRRPEEASPPVR